MPDVIEPTPDVNAQLARLTGAFEKRFGRRPTAAATAPGRVNLIGEHTDYNAGFVLPMAIERQTIIVAAPRSDGAATATLVSMEVEGEAVFEVGPNIERGEPAWSNYLRGVVAGCVERGEDGGEGGEWKIGGFDAMLNSSVPTGGGLSSSASINVATATMLEALTGEQLDPVDKALLAQRAEHDFAGTPCGIMDPFIASLGEPNHALLIDCRSHETQLVPLNDPAITVLIINSNMEHELVGGEYARRREQCAAAARALGVRALRDATMADLNAARHDLDNVVYRRARHVITENDRTRAASEAMVAGDWGKFGDFMCESHASLREDFEVSTRELDKLVEIALHRPNGDVYGSRMTGGGFGGCTVSLVRTNALHEVAGDIAANYESATGIAPTCFATRPAAGARVLPLR